MCVCVCVCGVYMCTGMGREVDLGMCVYMCRYGCEMGRGGEPGNVSCVCTCVGMDVRWAGEVNLGNGCEMGRGGEPGYVCVHV